MECDFAMKRDELTQDTTRLNLEDKPDPEGQMFYDSTYRRFVEQSNPWTEAGQRTPGAGKSTAGAVRRSYLMGTEFLLGMIESSGHRQWLWLHNTVNVRNATEFHD